MIKYKLTNGFQEIGRTILALGNSDRLTHNHWIHYYHHPLLAVIFNSLVDKLPFPILYEIKALGRHLDEDGIIGGCTRMTFIRELPLPEMTINQKIAFGILCALEVTKDKDFVKWGNNWLNGDRSYKKARKMFKKTFGKEHYESAAAITFAILFLSHDYCESTISAADAAAKAAKMKKLDLIDLAIKSLKY